jgi:hypothetical protein
MTGEGYEAAKPVPIRTPAYGDPWQRGHDPVLDAWLNAMDDDPNYSDYLTLIARVREDERISWGEHLARTQITNVDLANESAAKYLEGRKDALSAARAAVYRTCGHTKYEGCSPCAHDDAAAAIDAIARGGTDE